VQNPLIDEEIARARELCQQARLDETEAVCERARALAGRSPQRPVGRTAREVERAFRAMWDAR
jgi:hypothetical protein